MNISENDNNNENNLKFSSDESNEKDKSIEEENINKIENNSDIKNEEEEEQKTINNSDIKNVEEEEQKTINNSDIKTINNTEVKNVEEEEQKTINNSDSIEIENNNKSIQNENFEDSKLSASKQSNKEIIKNVEEELNKSDNKSKNQKHSKKKKNSIFNKKENYYKKAELYYNSLSQEEKKKLSNIVTYIKGQNHQLNEEELKEIFKKLDVNERDKINFEDLKNFLGVLRTNVNNYYINEIIKEYGNDKKEITQKILIKKMNENIKGKYKKDDITELREIFQLFDTNHDNKITSEDLKNVMNALGETSFSDEMCKDMIKFLKKKIDDKSNNEHLTYDDFIEIVKGESEQ